MICQHLVPVCSQLTNHDIFLNLAQELLIHIQSRVHENIDASKEFDLKRFSLYLILITHQEQQLYSPENKNYQFYHSSPADNIQSAPRCDHYQLKLA